MKLGGNRPPGHDVLLFFRGGMGSFIIKPSRTDTAGHPKIFGYPVMGHCVGGGQGGQADTYQRHLNPKLSRPTWVLYSCISVSTYRSICITTYMSRQTRAEEPETDQHD